MFQRYFLLFQAGKKVFAFSLQTSEEAGHFIKVQRLLGALQYSVPDQRQRR